MLTKVNKKGEVYDIKNIRRIFEDDVCFRKTKWKYTCYRYSKKMNCTKPSVNKAIYNLKDNGLVSYETYGTIELTEDGVNLAKKILEAYDIVYLFLKDVLNLNEDKAEKEVKKLNQV